MSLRISSIKIKKIIVILLNLMAFSVPMGASVLSFDVRVARLSFFRLLFLIVVFFYILSQKIKPGIVLYNKKNNVSVIFFMFWFLWACISIAWGFDIVGHMRILFFLAEALALIIVVENVCEQNELKNLLRSFNLGILVQAIIGLYEYVTTDYGFIEPSTLLFFKSRGYRYPIAMMYNSNDFSTAMYLGVMISFYCFNDVNRKTIYRFFYLGCMILYIFLILVGGSRAVQIGVFCAFLFMFTMMNGKKYGITITACCLGLLFLPNVRNLIMSHINVDYYHTRGESFETRYNLIRNGFLFLEKTIGIGVGNGQVEYWMRNYALYPVKNVENMHNYWMEILVEYGVVVFGGYIIFYLKMIIDFCKEYARKKKKEYGIQMLGLAGTLVGFVLSSISSSSNISKEYIWLFFAICIAIQKNLIGQNVEKCNGQSKIKTKGIYQESL